MNRNRWVRADGYLPLTNASRIKVDLLFWATAALLPLSFVVAALGAATRSEVLLAAGVVLLAGFVAGVVIYRVLLPGAKVSDPPSKFDARWREGSGYRGNLVELRRVHPAFVAAVEQLQSAAGTSAS